MDVEAPANTTNVSQWCLVGNIVEPPPAPLDRPIAPPSSKHFSGGTKVYCLPARWGDGYDKIRAIGRHRGSKQFVTLIISADRVTNWRAKVVYDPEVLRRLAQFPYNWETKDHVDVYIGFLVERPI